MLFLSETETLLIKGKLLSDKCNKLTPWLMLVRGTASLVQGREEDASWRVII